MRQVGARLIGAPVRRVDLAGGLIFIRCALAHVDGGDVVVPAFFENPVVLRGGVDIQIHQPVG